MPDFSEIFIKNKGKPIQYKGKTLVMTDYIPFEDGDRFLFTFEQTNSEWRQGIGLYMFGHIEIECLKKTVEDRTVFFEDTSPKEIIVSLWAEKIRKYHPKRLPKKNLLGIKNIWDTGSGSIESWDWGAAMIVEEIENGKRYRCNDGHPDEDFDDIVFTVQRLKSS